MSSIDHHESFRRSITAIHTGGGRCTFKRLSRSYSLPSAGITASAFEESTETATIVPPTSPTTGRHNSAKKVAPAPEPLASKPKVQRSYSEDAIVPCQYDVHDGYHPAVNSNISRRNSHSKSCPIEERGVQRATSSATLITQADAFDFEFRPEPKEAENDVKERYSLGETVRCPSHMIIEADDVAARNAALTLKNYEFAFVKRSDRQWTYAILAYRSFENVYKGKPHKPKDMQDCMTFVVNCHGALKTIEEKRWGQYIRLVSDCVQGAKRNLIDDVLAADDDSIASDLFE